MNIYLKYGVTIDFVTGFIVGLLTYICVYKFDVVIGELDNLISNLISTDVSLAGFILAALTIIIAFRSNVQVKINEREELNKLLNEKSPGNRPLKHESALELIFSSKNYFKIVRVFKQALIELTVCFSGLYIIWLLNSLLNPNLEYAVVVGVVSITILSISRSLFVLFLVLSLEGAKRN